jgi:hypothetical protein
LEKIHPPISRPHFVDGNLCGNKRSDVFSAHGSGLPDHARFVNLEIKK